MSEAPEVPDLVRDLQELCADATDLRSLLDGLLHAIGLRLPSAKLLAVARTSGRTEVRCAGIPGAVFGELREHFADAGGETDLPGPFPGLAGETEAGLRALDREVEDGGSVLLPSLGPFRIFACGHAERRFALTLFVDEGAVGSWDAVLRDALDEIAPSLARVADVDALKGKLGEASELVEDLSIVFDALPDPVVVLDADERVFMANRRAESLFQATQDDSEGRRRAVQANNLYFSAFRARSALADGGGERELVLVDPDDGGDLLCEVTAVAGEGATRARSRVIYILRDITDLKRAAGELETHYRRLLAAEHQLRRETERLNVIIENAGVPILVTDERSDIVLLNREAERLFEVAPPGAEGDADFRPLRSNDAVLTGLISDFLLQPQPRREEEVELTDPEADRPFPARVTLTKVGARRGEPTAVVSVLHDLTSEAENEALARKLSTLNAELEQRIEEAVHELAERNRQLDEQREQLAEASRLKTEFLAMMSHELRTPLNSILGYSSLLSEGLLGDLTPDQSRALSKTRSASEHLLSLINDILDLSKVEAGKMTLILETVPVGDFMGEFEEACRPIVTGAPLEFRIRLEDGLPPIRVDSTRLRQVLLNLVSNAVKFTDEGFVHLRVTPDGDDRRWVRFEVEDTGIGIEEKNFEAIFEGFRQLEDFPTRAQKGTGLGLAISRKLVGLMGGTLQVSSVHGEGSTFWFTVPAAEERSEGAAERPTNGRGATAGTARRERV